MCEYGCWPIYLPDSDLYIVDLQEAKKNGKFEYHKMSINSDDSESWHSWSGNSRWMIFSSKREHPSFSRPYISYLDKKGIFTKPFRLPQEDPAFYDSYLKTYTMPTFSPFPFQIPEKKIAAALTNHSAKVMPIPRSKEVTGSAAQYPQSQ
jgi:hypothetical protein